VSDLRAGERKRAIIESVTDQLKNISQMSTLTTVAWRIASSTLWPGSTPARGAKRSRRLTFVSTSSGSRQSWFSEFAYVELMLI
jgi:hypothetical protein